MNQSKRNGYRPAASVRNQTVDRGHVDGDVHDAEKRVCLGVRRAADTRIAQQRDDNSSSS